MRPIERAGHHFRELQEIVTPNFVQAANESNRRVDVWTVNKEQDMRRQLGYGVDGIMTSGRSVLNRVLQGGGKVR